MCSPKKCPPAPKKETAQKGRLGKASRTARGQFPLKGTEDTLHARILFNGITGEDFMRYVDLFDIYTPIDGDLETVYTDNGLGSPDGDLETVYTDNGLGSPDEDLATAYDNFYFVNAMYA